MSSLNKLIKKEIIRKIAKELLWYICILLIMALPTIGFILFLKEQTAPYTIYIGRDDCNYIGSAFGGYTPVLDKNKKIICGRSKNE